MAAVVKVPLISVFVYRGGKNKRLEIGKSFAFTQEEVDQILKAHPNGLRDPIGERIAVPEPEAPPAPPAPPPTPPSPPAPTGKTTPKGKPGKPADDDDEDQL